MNKGKEIFKCGFGVGILSLFTFESLMNVLVGIPSLLDWFSIVCLPIVIGCIFIYKKKMVEALE